MYSARATIGGDQLVAAVNVGTRPTVSGESVRAEAHLMHSDGSSWTPPHDHPEYGWDLTLRLVGWIRDEVGFPDLEALKDQIARDRVRAVETALA